MRKIRAWDIIGKCMYPDIWFTDFDGTYFKPGGFEIYDNPYDKDSECRLIFMDATGKKDKNRQLLYENDWVKLVCGFIGVITYRAPVWAIVNSNGVKLLAEFMSCEIEKLNNDYELAEQNKNLIDNNWNEINTKRRNDA